MLQGDGPGKALDQGALDGAQPIGATEITFDIGDKAIECLGRESLSDRILTAKNRCAALFVSTRPRTGRSQRLRAPLARNFAPPLLPFVLAPILFGFAPHGGCIRVLHFEPIGRAAGTVGGILALRDNAFEPELAREARLSPRARQCDPSGAGRVAFTSTGSEVWCGSYLSSHSRLCSGAGIV